MNTMIDFEHSNIIKPICNFGMLFSYQMDWLQNVEEIFFADFFVIHKSRKNHQF